MPIESEGTITSTSEQRNLIAVLLLGGLFLVVMGQVIYGDVYELTRWLVGLLVLIGLSAFVLAGYLISRHRLPRQLISVGRRVSGFFGISAGQLLLLFFAPTFALMAGLAAGDEFRAINLSVSLLAWLIGIVAVLVGSYKPVKGKGLERLDIIAAGILFLGAFMIRAIFVNDIPTTLSGDEGSAGLAALKFLNGDTNNIFTVGWFSFPNMYFALQSVGIMVFGQSITALRISSAVGGALAVVGLYFLARTLFDRTTAILAAIFLAAFHYHIHFSRIGLNNIWDSFFVVIVFGALWYGWKSGRRSSFMIAGIALGMGQYFYVSVRIVPVLIVIWSGLAFLTDRQRFKRRLPDLILLAFIAFVVALPLMLFFLKYPEQYNAPFHRVTIFNGWLTQMVLLEGKPAALIIWDQIVKSAFGFTHAPLRLLYNPGSALLLPAASGLFLLGILWGLAHISLRYMIIFLPLLAVIATSSLSVDAPASQRYIIAVPMVAILVVLPLAVITKWLVENFPRYRMVIAAALAVFMFILVINEIRYYFFEVYDEYVLGGVNTAVATEAANYLRDQEPFPDVYFFGLPRMGYYSLSTIPYLVPEVRGIDVVEPLTALPPWRLEQSTAFLFLPERIGELAFVRSAYPGGAYHEMKQENGTVLFLTYEVPYP